MLKKLFNWYQNKSQTCDSLELEQGRIRIIAGVVIFVFSFYHYASHKLAENELIVFHINFVFEILAFTLFLLILNKKGSPSARKVLGAWLDVTTATTFMTLTNDIGVALVIVYLWVIFGNGFRYGNKYLFHAQLLSITGFIVTLIYSPYWQAHATVGYSLLAMLIILPLYVAQLITRLNEAKLKAEQASSRAEEANLAKTRFVANMSHEIRTPLNGIIGIGALIKNTPLNADQQDLIKTLDSSSKLLLSLLNNVLDFTKIEEKKLNIEKIEFSIEEAVNDTVEIFRAQAKTKNIQLAASSFTNPAKTKGDAVVLRQVLANLMGNALKFTLEGSVILSAITLKDTDSALTVRFEVADTGVGIATDKQSKIFESFTQADSSTTRKFGGSGLGLTIAKEMVEAMGATLKFQSTENVGSRFWFDLTLEKIKIADVPLIQTKSAPSLGIRQAKPLNILVCEDEGTNQKIITRILATPGHEVTVAASSDEMLDLLEQQKFDLVITDLNMAGMTGADALKLYRFTQPEDKDTKFILFTADATLAARQQASEAGFDAFLTKPVEPAALFNTIEEIMQLEAGTAANWMRTSFSQPVPVQSDLSKDNPALDLDTLLDLERIGAGDDLFMHRLLRNYLTDSLKMIEKIELAIKQKQQAELQDLCHAFKGNSLSVGAVQIANTTDVISKLPITLPTNQKLLMLKDLNRQFADLTLAVEDYLRRPEAAAGR